MWLTRRSTAGLAVLLLVAAACGDVVVPATSAPPTQSTAGPSPTGTTEPAPTDGPHATPPVDERFDLTGTAWRVTAVDGKAIDPDGAPVVKFDFFGRPYGGGFTGCDEFGFSGAFVDGRAVVFDFTVNPAGCSGTGASVEARFLEVLHEVEAWSVEGDVLTMWGSTGTLTLSRELPPEGDATRELAEALHAGAWWIVEAPGVTAPDRLSPIEFDDYILLGRGICGFASDLEFQAGGGVDIVELGWDAMSCGEPDEREALKSTLDAVTTGILADDWSVHLSGPAGDVILVQH